VPVARGGAVRAWILGAAMVAGAVSASGQGGQLSPLLPLLEIVVLPRDLLAIDSETGGDKDTRLELGEKVLWTATQGRVGVAVTDRRVLMVSNLSGAWQETRYLAKERIPTRDDLLLGDRVLLLLTDKRALAFDSVNRNLVEVVTTPQEGWTTERVVGANVVVVLTNRRALAFSAPAGGFFDQKLRLDETPRELHAYANHVSLQTPLRLLVFRATTGSWSETRLGINK
jgi:hypothetical protein